MDTLADLTDPQLAASPLHLVPGEGDRRAARGSTRATRDHDADPPLLLVRLDDGRELAIDRAVQVGAAPANDLVLDDPFVSGVHCALVRHAGRTLVRDLGSRNGCWLAGNRVRVAELTAGARLTVGGTTLRLVAATGAGGPLLGTSPEVARLRHELACAAPTGLPVLLLGESGTGKELAARALHDGSGSRGALVAINCGALSSELAESELFGHERGAFTGAAGRRAGLFVEADGGTLFLDEIGELPPALQPKLLRTLETGVVRPVGATGERRVDVRVVAATHRDLPAAIAAQRFRLDLYHRLSAIEIQLPPLRGRRGDIALLARHFLDESGVGGPAREFSPAAMTALARHGWPGNVRELRNAVQRAAHLGGQVIEPRDLFPDRAPPPPPPQPEGAAAAAGFPGGTLRLEDLQRQAIERALAQHGGRIRPAARALGIPASTLHDRLRRLGVRPGRGG